jgi:hypothetical protein
MADATMTKIVLMSRLMGEWSEWWYAEELIERLATRSSGAERKEILRVLVAEFQRDYTAPVKHEELTAN